LEEVDSVEESDVGTRKLLKKKKNCDYDEGAPSGRAD